MLPDLSPERVAARLSLLRASWSPMTEAEARALLEGPPALPFAEAVAQRLAELRALSDLTRHLHARAR